MRKRFWFYFAVVALATSVVHATTAPRNGGPLPAAMRARMQSDPTAYQMTGAWTHRIRAHATKGVDAAYAPYAAVTGTIGVPVIAGYFSDVTVPYAPDSLQNKLFDYPSGTVTDYWDEVSYGNLNMTGNVYGWTQVSSPGSYYAGTNNGTEPLTDHVGEFIKELLVANDAVIDFGQYDNDGPDGVPNSGDDDGFVDFIAIVHSSIGGECGGNSNIWSHRWVYSAWNASGGVPYQTNDASNAPGVSQIQVNDYSIQPAWNCDGTTVIDIGVFCHEFGHALGLPDLYDPSGITSGIGEWGIMGSGNWNTPDSPAHPCAWTRKELGWVAPTDVTWDTGNIMVPDINTNAFALRLPFTSHRFRRSATCAINGSASLYCGLTPAEAAARGWPSAPGYGSSWDETISREFTYDGSGPVIAQWNYAADLEAGYDFAYAIVDTGAGEVIVDTYSGVTSGAANHDISSILAPLAPGDMYTIKFRVVTDASFANDDGSYPSSCGALAIDDVSVNGGGEAYATDFETYADGWYQSYADNPASEYWLVENRQATGFDQHLRNPGLLIFHVDESVLDAFGQINAGGPAGGLVRGLMLEEADGLEQLLTAVNNGDGGDPYPGTSDNRAFTGATIPSSQSNSGSATTVEVTDISNPSSMMSGTFVAGDPAPVATMVDPNVIDNDQLAAVATISGSALQPGATAVFVFAGSTADSDTSDIVPASVGWVDASRIACTLNVYGKSSGAWDLIVTNPDGQTDTLAAALDINYIVATQLRSAVVRALKGAVSLAYAFTDVDEGEVLTLSRSGDGGMTFRPIATDAPRPGPGEFTFVDEDVEPGREYVYVLTAEVDGETRELHRARVTIPAESLVLFQNVPNPFNPTTSISFSLPERASVMLRVYDASGAYVTTLADGVFAPGAHTAVWNGRNANGTPVASGVYFYRLVSGKHTLTKKMLLLK